MSSSNERRVRELNRLKLALATFALHLDAFEERTHGLLRSIGRLADDGLPVTEPRKEAPLPVNKVTWQRVGHVTEPGRYMFRFGWLTIAPDDLAIWEQFPNASFTLVQTQARPLASGAEAVGGLATEASEFHLGAFELPTNDDFHEQHAAA